MTKTLIVSDGAGTAPCQVLGERITILASHGQTGSYEVYLHDAPEGVGPPPHFHPWDEAFYVIDGAVDFDCDGTLKKVAAGGFVHVPAGMVHSFRYASPTARVLGITSGAGASELFAAIDRECPGATPDMGKLMGVLSGHQVGLGGQTG